LSDDHWPHLQQLFLMETSRLSGRVPQDSFVELAGLILAFLPFFTSVAALCPKLHLKQSFPFRLNCGAGSGLRH